MHPLTITAILAVSSLLLTVASSAELETAYKWRYIDFNWPSQASRTKAIRTGAYNISASMPKDVDVSQDGRVFIAIRNKTGVPARLGYVTDKKSVAGPLLQPYPDWSWHQGDDCDTSINDVSKISIDKCDRLWVLDTGRRNRCSPKLLVFDTKQDSLILRVTIPDEIVLEARTKLEYVATIVVETYGHECEDTTEIVAQDSERLQYADGIKVVREPAVPEEEIWVLSNRHNLFRTNQMNFNQYNLYVLRSPVRRLIAGTKCELPTGVRNTPKY
ncbi:hypothetical protein QAD02_000812 [Eretmocerus hayati]|uniref:Uncharacterized protein n=1 Tax=Eretmocerus hayati TaxID=131215 RepID=A0ACC2NF49_9HYME|nr:hypothetical protein QAD02_000812 [Eretmocerus hayati]